MPEDAMLDCLVCGVALANAIHTQINQPQEGTEFTSFGHYGSTFWDSFEGEQIVINICDECLTKNTDKIGRHKRYRRIHVQDPDVGAHHEVGRQWVKREMVPYFEGPEDIDPITIEPEEIGTLTGYGHIEWRDDWQQLKTDLLTRYQEKEEKQ